VKIIRPETITDSIFQSSTVTEADESEWASGTTYADAALVMVTGTGGGAATATHKIYESQQGSNTGNDPTIDDGTYWVEVSRRIAGRCLMLSCRIRLRLLAA